MIGVRATIFSLVNFDHAGHVVAVTLSQESGRFGTGLSCHLKSSDNRREGHEGQATYRRADYLRSAPSEGGIAVAEVCRQLGVSEASFYLWRKRYARLGLSALRAMRQLRDENARLKWLVADLTLGKHILGVVVRRKPWGQRAVARRQVRVDLDHQGLAIEVVQRGCQEFCVRA